MPRNRMPNFVVCALLLATASGCIEADSYFYLRYDKEKDSFSQLQIFSNIRCNSGADELYLLQLYVKGKDLVILPVSDLWKAPIAFYRLDGGKIHHLFLSVPPAEPKDWWAFREPIPVDLSAIKVKRGNFFLNQKKNLCYFHEMEVPGKTIDQVLPVINKKLSTPLVGNLLDELIKTNANEDLPRFSWAEVRKLSDDNAPKNPDPNAKWRGPFELASLQLLKKAAADEKLAFKRQGSWLQFHLPITKTDSKELIATMDHFKAAALEAYDKNMKNLEGVGNGPNSKVMADVAVKMVKQGIRYKLDPNGGVAFELDLAAVIPLANLINEYQEGLPRPALAPAAEAQYQANCKTAVMGLAFFTERMFDGKNPRAPYLAAK